MEREKGSCIIDMSSGNQSLDTGVGGPSFIVEVERCPTILRGGVQMNAWNGDGP